MPVGTLLSTKKKKKKKDRKGKGGGVEGAKRGILGKDCLEIQFVALSYATGFLCSSLVSLFLCKVCVVLINNLKIGEGAACPIWRQVSGLLKIYYREPLAL